MVFDTQQIQRETMVEQVELFATLPSTNDHAMQRAGDADCPKPLLVVAQEQTAGRGRGANRWWSTDGALTFSLLLDGGTPEPRPTISLAIGVALCDAIHTLRGKVTAGLKWPNDVYIEGRKVAGILIERPSHANRDYVVGIGLNVNNSVESAPAELQETATSLADVLGRRLDPQVVLIGLLQQIEKSVAALVADADTLHDRWRELCILNGRFVVIEAGQTQHAGICQGIDDAGSLLIETPQGVVRCNSGMIRSFE